MTHEHANRHAGQGPVVLDIGDDIGALVISAPASLAGHEIEAQPVRSDAGAQHATVLERTTRNGTVHSAVIAALTAGDYTIALLPDGPRAHRVAITGGEVTFTRWPG